LTKFILRQIKFFRQRASCIFKLVLIPVGCQTKEGQHAGLIIWNGHDFFLMFYSFNFLLTGSRAHAREPVIQVVGTFPLYCCPNNIYQRHFTGFKACFHIPLPGCIQPEKIKVFRISTMSLLIPATAPPPSSLCQPHSPPSACRRGPLRSCGSPPAPGRCRPAWW